MNLTVSSSAPKLRIATYLFHWWSNIFQVLDIQYFYQSFVIDADKISPVCFFVALIVISVPPKHKATQISLSASGPVILRLSTSISPILKQSSSFV